MHNGVCVYLPVNHNLTNKKKCYETQPATILKGTYEKQYPVFKPTVERYIPVPILCTCSVN